MELYFPACCKDIYPKANLIELTSISMLLDDYEKELNDMTAYLAKNCAQVDYEIPTEALIDAIENEYLRMDEEYLSKLRSIVGDKLGD